MCRRDVGKDAWSQWSICNVYLKSILELPLSLTLTRMLRYRILVLILAPLLTSCYFSVPQASVFSSVKWYLPCSIVVRFSLQHSSVTVSRCQYYSGSVS